MANNIKAKYWWAVLYPESMVDDWEENIADLVQLPYAYCVHDQDLDNDGDDRKKHIHLIIAFPNTTTYNHALNIFKELGSVSTCKRVISIRRAYNYLIHDTEDCEKKGKHLYGKDERITGNNFDIGAYEQIGLEEKAKIRRFLSAECINIGFINYGLFYQYVCNNYMNEPEYENIVVTYQGHFDKLCKSNRHKQDVLRMQE